MFSQSANILQFHEILKDAPNNFIKYKKDVVEEYAALDVKYYSTKIDDVPTQKNVIIECKGIATTFNIYLDPSKYGIDNKDELSKIVDDFYLEFKKMIKSGKYKASEKNKYVESETGISDLKGNLVATFNNNGEAKYIKIYGKLVDNKTEIVNEVAKPSQSNTSAADNKSTIIENSKTTTLNTATDGKNEGGIQHKQKEKIFIINDYYCWCFAKINQEPEVKKALLESNLYSQTDFNKIASLVNENGFPEAISTFLLRKSNGDMIKNYNAYNVANVKTQYASYYLLWFPKSENLHMPLEMQPISDDGFYMLTQVSSTSKTKVGSSQNTVYGLEKATSIYSQNSSTTQTTNGGIQYSTADMSQFQSAGAMLIIQNTTMYVFEIKGNASNQATLAAKCARDGGISGDYKYELKSGNNCETIKYKFAKAFTIYCKGSINSGK